MRKIGIFLVMGILLSVFLGQVRAGEIDRILSAPYGEEYVVRGSSEMIATAISFLPAKDYRTRFELKETEGAVGFWWDTVSFTTTTINAITASTTPVSTPFFVEKGSSTVQDVQPYGGIIYVLPDQSTSSATIRGSHFWR